MNGVHVRELQVYTRSSTQGTAVQWSKANVNEQRWVQANVLLTAMTTDTRVRTHLVSIATRLELIMLP